MPRYDFIGRTCNHRFESQSDFTQAQQGAQRPAQIPCEQCGGPADRQFPRRIQFRMGPDFYEAAYKRGEFDIPL